MFLVIGVVIGNFIWAMVASHDYHEAFKISFLQAIAVGGYWITIRKW